MKKIIYTILNSIVSKYVVPLDDIYLIHHTINNDESYLHDKSDSKIFYLGKYTVNGRRWVYKCEIDDYISIIEKKLRFIIDITFDERKNAIYSLIFF